MRGWILLGALSMLVDETVADFVLSCEPQANTIVATQEQDYAFESNSSVASAQQCCTRIITTDREASHVLLKLLRPPEVVCNATPSAYPGGAQIIFLVGQLLLTKPGLCNQRSERYTMAANGTTVCLLRSVYEPISDGTVRPFAISSVSALHVCESSVWQPRASMALSVRPSYVFAPDQRISIPIQGITVCAPGEDFIRVVIADSVGSMRVEVLAVPDASSCRSLLVQEKSVRVGESFAIAVGNQLAVSYNISRNTTCNAQSSSLIGFVVRLSDNSKANSDSSLGNTFASSGYQGASLMNNFGANSGSSFASVLRSTGYRGSGNDSILVLCAFVSSFLWR